MKILLLGANGQIGWELQRSLSPLGEINACTRKEADLEDPNALKPLIQTYQPEIIVNAAAYTSVDKAESEPEKAYSINAEAVAIMANEIKEFDGLLIYYSTDYIFDGTKPTPYTEKDQPNPQSVYGKTKHQGEVIIKASGCKHIIFRTSGVYALRGTNFVKTVIKLGKEREELKVVNDQIGVPTSAELIADITALSLYKITQQENHPQKKNIEPVLVGGIVIGDMNQGFDLFLFYLRSFNKRSIKRMLFLFREFNSFIVRQANELRHLHDILFEKHAHLTHLRGIRWARQIIPSGQTYRKNEGSPKRNSPARVLLFHLSKIFRQFRFT